VLLRTGRYKGNPFGAHLPFRDRLSPEHFERWLVLWAQAARQRLDPRIAQVLETKANHIAGSLRGGLLFKPASGAEKYSAVPLSS
ncbi:hypothetical protein C1X42_32795, partial [Pseudomonas sp. FW305-BF8]|uniref:group III truncated hemoglobin n=1 Tax=Pseudomonas sp. FW305-BF8 TaxID=2070602 RepID=UPI000CC134B8